ncbi:amidase family protein [Pseudoscardovia radai]|uniref:amidase family protein n=1 Tax=Pseudoscardovia radai TaxID=987066 RepID=UPI0039949FE2
MTVQASQNQRPRLAELPSLVDFPLADMQRLIRTGGLTSTELTVGYLNRLFYYDRNGAHLNSTPLIAADALAQAMERDEEHASGRDRGALQGIPFSVKDSYMVKGMTMAAGSPAFAHVTANEDSFSVEALKAAGAVVIGKTTMPPMAAGGMQRGVYGRAENPYNRQYLAAAWDSGSSNGSGVSTAASLAAFGLAEETVSSGRSPAANNGLVAYTPSRGVISLRGNWPLHATKDVVVPHTRTMDDLLTILPFLIADDPDTRGDMWRWQKHVSLDGARIVKEAGVDGLTETDVLAGLRIGVVCEYAGRRGGTVPSVYIRPSIDSLLLRAIGDLESLGASVEWTPLPIRDLYESAPRTLEAFARRGLIPADWMEHEWLQLNAAVLEEFIHDFDMSGVSSLLDVDPDDIFPNPHDSVDFRTGRQYGFYQKAAEYMRAGRLLPAKDTPELAEGLRGLERIRRECFESWMREAGFDLLIFPTNSNIGRADAETDEALYVEAALQDGAFFSNGNRMIRHLGIPTVSVTMGLMEDTGVPAGLTFAGPSGSDRLLLAAAAQYEHATKRRVAPRRTPDIAPAERIGFDVTPGGPTGGAFPGKLHASMDGKTLRFAVVPVVPADKVACRVFVNGTLVAQWSAGQEWTGSVHAARFFDDSTLGVVSEFTGRGGRVGADMAVLANPFAGPSAGSVI